ncbi:MAG: hypothetical protein GY814_13055 [Gammaproteobacteria bacterium]|nr:hypothetical protein [Gammaproteobacteria bacterium]
MLDKLKKIFRAQPDIDELFSSLPAPMPFRFALDRIPKGIDNAHLDVYLSPKFTNSVRMLVRRMLLHDIGVNRWGESSPPPSVRDISNFEQAYTGVLEAGVGKAREESSPDQIQLLQFAILKYLLLSVGDELVRHRDKLQQARTIGGDQSSGHAVHLHEKLVLLAKEEMALRYRITRKLFRHVYKLESGTLRKLRKSVLGRSWPVPKMILFNPLLQLPSLWAEEQFMHHYPLMIVSKEDPERFSYINSVLTDILSVGLPAWALASCLPKDTVGEADADGDSVGVRLRQDRGMLSGFLETELLLVGSVQSDEYVAGLSSWLDDPGNIEAILFLNTPNAPARSSHRLRVDDAGGRARWIKVQRYILDEVQRRFKRAGLWAKIFATNEAPKVFKELHGRVPLGLINQYLEGGLSKRKLLLRLSGLKGVSQPHIAKKVLDNAAERIRNMSDSRREYRIKCFIRDFMVLRCDLKLAYQTHRTMNSIRILLRDEAIELSRRNNSLQEFVQHTEADVEKRKIKNHVIIKADLRGSTAITAELLDNNLNPASHFSLNFFQPITKLLDAFGAVKVFVEGDAVILCITEYEDAPHQWLCVSYASGLARKMLQVVDAQNAKNRKHGLPELELGLGISFNDGSPAFLYDGDQQIMISPAINRADRLSSCAAVLRRTALGEKIKRGVEVVVSVDQGTVRKDQNDELLSFNVNGIELDMPAFFKLKTELALLRIQGSIAEYSEHSVFYAGRYPDRAGRMHWLVVREAPVRLWIGNSINTEEEWGRRFYEVITDLDAIACLKKLIMDKKGDEEMQPGIDECPAGDSDGAQYIH